MTALRLALVAVALCALSACGRPSAPDASADAALLTAPWDSVTAAARGQTLHVAMWGGDPFVNRYVQEVARRLEREHGIATEFVALQGSQIVTALLTEQEAGARSSAYDLVWINGETFYQLRQIDALWGPFVERLPHARFLDLDNPFIGLDFQQPVDGFEAPWGNVQFVLVHDTRRVPVPPLTPEALAAWIEANPGRFTFDTEFTGLTFLKSLLIHFAGETLDGPFSEARYAAASDSLFRYLDRIRPHLWRGGETFPTGVAQLHQLFASGEVDFTMSNNDGEVDNKALQGVLPETARGYALTTGTIQNTHYWGIPRGATAKAAALVAIDAMLSPAAQYRKLQPAVWGDGTVLDVARLPAAWADSFAAVPGRRLAPPRAALQPYALPEPAAEYTIRLAADVRARVFNMRP